MGGTNSVSQVLFSLPTVKLQWLHQSIGLPPPTNLGPLDPLWFVSWLDLGSESRSHLTLLWQLTKIVPPWKKGPPSPCKMQKFGHDPTKWSCPKLHARSFHGKERRFGQDSKDLDCWKWFFFSANLDKSKFLEILT